MSPKKILIITVPADGHFNPLTGIATHLKQSGHDVRWYTQDFYKAKLEKLGIPHFPFVKQPQLNQENFREYFKERDNMKTQISKLRFDFEHFFIRRCPEAVEDIATIHETFPFDLVIGDLLCFSLPIVKKLFNVPVIVAGIVPVAESSVDLPPSGMGLLPSHSVFSGLRNWLVRVMSNQLIFGKVEQIYRDILNNYSVEAPQGNLFDIIYRSVDMVWQSGSPGFEYKRSDWNPRLRFVGPLLPHKMPHRVPYILRMKQRYEKVVLVTQGTAEADIEKILVPTLEAYRNTNTMVIATTGSNGTAKLRERFPESNFVIEDFIPYSDVMPICDVYITNGGYGGVLLGIQNKLPMVVAGVHEGKNEICARIGYFDLGINLKTEKPSAEMIRKAVEKISSDKKYKKNVQLLAAEFRTYDTNKIISDSLAELLQPGQSIIRTIPEVSKKVTA